MSNKPKISFPKKIDSEVTERKLASPFISEKKIKGHTDEVYDSTTATFPDGKDRIITCSDDETLRIFNLEEQKCEKIIKHTTSIYSVHFYEEEELLMATDYNGELLIFELFPEIKIIKKIKVAETGSFFWRITQISSNEFFCGVLNGPSPSREYLFRIRFNKNNKWISEEIEYPTYNNNDKKEGLRCIYQLISQKNIILFSGGGLIREGGVDFTIKSIDLNNNNNFHRFPRKHSDVVFCLTSFINSKNQEIILSGGQDERIMFWSLKGIYLKAIKFDGGVDYFLNDFSRKNIFIAGGYENDIYICSFSIETEELERIVENIHNNVIFSLKWINKENQNKFFSCFDDETFNIYELEEVKYLVEPKNIKKTYDCLEEMSDCQIKFRNKNINFWNTFMNEKEENQNLGEFKLMETNINERILFSVIMGENTEISFDHLTDYYYFFKIINLKHCIAAINRKIKKTNEFEKVYILFKNFCLKYENEVIKSWFSDSDQEVILHPTTFNTSFALSLFNRMRKMKEILANESKFPDEIKYGRVWNYLECKPFQMMNHNDFRGVENENELKVEYYFKKLYENRAANSNLTLISTDKREFKVHKEILILQYDFFFLLFKFRGLEVTEYEKTGEIALVDLMSSDVVEALISYAYLGELDLKNEGISSINTFCKLLIFCDQFSEEKMMRKVKDEFTGFMNDLSMNRSQPVDKVQNVVKIMSGLSNSLVGNEKILLVIFPLLEKLGVGAKEFYENLVLQHENEKMMKKEEYEKKEKKLLQQLVVKEESEKMIRERVLELEKLVGEMNEEDDEGVGEGQIRVREDDEEIKKDEPKRKKRKINKI